MKTQIKLFILATSAAIYFSSCSKESVAPVAVQSANVAATTTAPVVNNTTTTAATTTATTTTTVATTNADTSSSIRLQLAKDAVNSATIVIAFNANASAAYVKNEDAATLNGMGMVSLSSLSSDNVALAINVLPLTNTTTIALKVAANADGVYTLNAAAIKNIPANYNITLKDNYLGTSVNFRTISNYAFNITNANAATYGTSRFSLVISAN